MLQSVRRDNNSRNMGYAIKNFIYLYTIYQDGKAVEHNLKGWRTALAHARRWTKNLFDDINHKVEILNIWTGEIIRLEEAEKRAKNLRQ